MQHRADTARWGGSGSLAPACRLRYAKRIVLILYLILAFSTLLVLGVALVVYRHVRRHMQRAHAEPPLAPEGQTRRGPTPAARRIRPVSRSDGGVEP